MFISNGVIQLFPTHLWIHKFATDFHEPIDQQIEDELLRRFGDRVHDASAALQTTHDFHRCEAMRKLVPRFEEAVAGVLGYLKTKSQDFAITGCWANSSSPGQKHERHCHPNNFLAGVYFARAAEGANIIQFEDPRPHWMHVAPDRQEYTPENANTVDVSIEPGTLILFPAWLMHEVPPNRSSTPRMSVAFNVMFKDFAEKISPPQWQPVEKSSG